MKPFVWKLLYSEYNLQTKGFICPLLGVLLIIPDFNSIEMDGIYE